METKRYVLRPEFFGGILFDRERKEYFYLDGKTTDALLAQEFSFSRSYMDFLAGEKIVVTERGRTRFNGIAIKYSARPADFPAAPLRVHLAITYKCPLNCKHCFVKNYKRRQKEMSLAELKGLIDCCVKNGIYEILVSGGEPLARKDLREFLAYALEKKMIVKLFTNGLFLDEKRIMELKGLGLSYLSIGFDGADSISYNSLRGGKGKSLFNKVVINVRRAKKMLDIPVATQFTCTRRNTDQKTLSRLVKFSLANNILLRVRPVNPCGGALSNPDLFLDYREYLSVLQRLHEFFLKHGYSAKGMGAKQGNIRFKFSRRSIKFDESPLPYLGWGCPGGYVHAFIDPYGNMHPCGFLIKQLSENVSDNIKKRDLADIWLHGKAFICKRSLSGNKTCYGCKHFIICRGGCRARALYWKKDINAPDQYCRQDLEASSEIKKSFLNHDDCV